MQGLRARVYVAAPPDYANAPSLIRQKSAPISCVYAHRHITRVSEPDRCEMVRLILAHSDYSLVYPVGSWVRIRQGRYVGDVGYVFNSSSEHDELQLLVVPKPGHNQTFQRPSRSLNFLRRVTHEEKEVEELKDPFVIGGSLFFSNGLRLITVQGLHYAHVCRPSPEDVWAFSLAGLDTADVTNRAFLGVGETVRIKKGEMVGAEGIVIWTGDDIVDVATLDETDTVHTVHMAYVSRVFASGDSVLIKLGKFKDETGMVVTATEAHATVLFDRDNVQVCVLNILYTQGHELTNLVLGRHLNSSFGIVQSRIPTPAHSNIRLDEAQELDRASKNSSSDVQASVHHSSSTIWPSLWHIQERGVLLRPAQR